MKLIILLILGAELYVCFAITRTLLSEVAKHDVHWFKEPGYNSSQKVDRRTRLEYFRWKNCPGVTAIFTYLSIQPDPVKLPGNFTLAFKADVNITLQSPLQTNFTVNTKIGNQWLPIPCLAPKFGSCSYDDLCKILRSAYCPPAFTNAGIPCVCPVNIGAYLLPPSVLSTYINVPAGEYFVRISAGMNSTSAVCVEMYISTKN